MGGVDAAAGEFALLIFFGDGGGAVVGGQDYQDVAGAGLGFGGADEIADQDVDAAGGVVDFFGIGAIAVTYVIVAGVADGEHIDFRGGA